MVAQAQDIQQRLLQTVIRRDRDLTADIASGGRATGKIETKANIHGIYLYCSASGTGLTNAEFLTDIGDIKIRINGETIVEASAAQILPLYKYHNDRHTAHTVAGVLPIYFPRQDLPIADMNRGFSLGMLAEDGIGHNVLTYEVNFLSPGGGMTVDAIELHYEHDLRPPEKLGHHVRLLRHTRTFSTTGYQSITDLPKDESGTAVLAYHIVSGNVSRVTFKTDGRDRLEDVPKGVLDVQQHRSGRKPQSGWTHVDFSIHNDLQSMLPLGVGNITDMLLKPYWSSSPSGNYYIMAEEIHNGL